MAGWGQRGYLVTESLLNPAEEEAAAWRQKRIKLPTGKKRKHAALSILRIGAKAIRYLCDQS